MLPSEVLGKREEQETTDCVGAGNEQTMYDYIGLIFTIDPGLGCISFEALVAFIVTLAVVFAVVRRSKDWPEAIRLHIGLVLLSA